MHSPSTFCSRLRAFTLIELLVVVSIIAILAAMLLPALSSARATAKISLCSANKKQLMLGMANYVSDSDDSMPSQGRLLADYNNATIGNWTSARWHSEQNPQQGDPTCRFYAWGKLWPGKYFGLGQVLYCTDNPLSWNASGMAWSGYENALVPWLLPTKQYELDKPNDGANRFVLSGAAWASPWLMSKENNLIATSFQIPFYQANNLDYRKADRMFVSDISFGGQSWVSSCRPAVPHSRRGVVRAAADGHVDFLNNPWPAGATDFGVGHPWEASQPQNQGLGVQNAILTTLMR